MELYPDAQERIENAMRTVLGLENEAQVYADAEVGEDILLLVESDDDTVYIFVSFDDPPELLPASLVDVDDEMNELVQLIERTYLRVQNRRTSFDFTLDQSVSTPRYRVERPLVVEDDDPN